MTKLILHIGYGKTGTTHLQSAFQQNHTALLDQGVLYPIMRNGFTKHAPLVPHIAALKNPSPYHQIWAESDPISESRHHWEDTVAQISSAQPHTVVLSDESFINCHGRTAEMAACLSPYFNEICAVAYVESPQKLFLKTMQQWLKTRGIANTGRAQPYRKQLSSFAANPVFDFQAHIYDVAGFPNGDILAHFTDLYCPEWPNIDAVHASGAKNRGFSAEAMSVAETYGAFLHEDNLAARIQKWSGVCRTIIAADAAVTGYERPKLLEPVADHIQRSHPDLLWLRDRFGLEFRDVDYTIASSDPEVAHPPLKVGSLCPVNSDRKAELLAYVVKQLGAPQSITFASP
jgi:hypothetical protein